MTDMVSISYLKWNRFKNFFLIFDRWKFKFLTVGILNFQSFLNFKKLVDRSMCFSFSVMTQLSKLLYVIWLLRFTSARFQYLMKNYKKYIVLVKTHSLKSNSTNVVRTRQCVQGAMLLEQLNPVTFKARVRAPNEKEDKEVRECGWVCEVATMKVRE